MKYTHTLKTFPAFNVIVLLSTKKKISNYYFMAKTDTSDSPRSFLFLLHRFFFSQENKSQEIKKKKEGKIKIRRTEKEETNKKYIKFFPHNLIMCHMYKLHSKFIC